MKSLLLNLFLSFIALGFSSQPVQSKTILSSSEIVKLLADVQVEECTNHHDLKLCTVPQILLKNVEITLYKKEIPPSESYELWEGNWHKNMTVEGIDFIGSLTVQKYRYHSENGLFYDSYRLGGAVGSEGLKSKPITTKISITVPSLDELNWLILAGETTQLDKMDLVPHLFLGPKVLEPLPIGPDPDKK